MVTDRTHRLREMCPPRPYLDAPYSSRLTGFLLKPPYLLHLTLKDLGEEDLVSRGLTPTPGAPDPSPLGKTGPLVPARTGPPESLG